jgi:hypothetical protein
MFKEKHNESFQFLDNRVSENSLTVGSPTAFCFGYSTLLMFLSNLHFNKYIKSFLNV